VIVVIGDVSAVGSVGEARPGGLAAAVAHGAVAEGGRVELVTRVGDDPVGDALLLAIAAEGIGHVATLRDAARPTPITDQDLEPMDPAAPESDGTTPEVGSVGPELDGADVALALRYLPEYLVVVVAHPSPDVLAEAGRAAAWASAHLVVLARPSDTTDAAGGLPEDSLVLVADGSATGVATTVGRYAAAVDAGSAPAVAFAAAFDGLDAI
jgi:hypothetical protein